MKSKRSRYIVVPNDNVYNEQMETNSRQFFRSMHTRTAGSQLSDSPPRRVIESEVGKMKVVDSINLNEATLVEMTADQAARFSRLYPGLRVKREVLLYPMKLSPAHMKLAAARLPVSSVRTLEVRCLDADTGRPVAGADVVIVLNREKGKGIIGVQTNGNGSFTTALPASQKVIDAVICAPLANYWPAEIVDVKTSAKSQTTIDVKVVPLKKGHHDPIAASILPSKSMDGKGVKIAVVDSGTSAASGLNIVQGLNTTEQEDAGLFSDNGSGHGTHVAGIIARLAPAAQLYIYRVFEKGSDAAGEFAIAKAIRQAVEDGCDLINLSLGQDTEPLAISRETRRARAMGVVCIAAAGNDFSGPVSYPARSGVMIAVSALGVSNTWPKGSMTGSNVATVPASIGDIFFASFSNVGEEMDFIAPGVGIISSVTETEYGIMDGTSMACPAITGLFARLLSRSAGLLKADRDQQRSDDIIKMAYMAAKPIGFGTIYEGSGLIERR